jgi:phenylpyruvate tautomerase PptA (4-oxalocrotonate tautomerase family)
MTGFERRLRSAWSSAVPKVPRHLQDYRQHWLDNLQAPLTGATHEEFLRALRNSELIVVSDYHPLERSRTGLAELIGELPSKNPLAFVLELLPFGTTLTAREALRGRGPDLVTGQSLLDAYGPALKILAERRGALVGAWVDGSVQRRDEVAAEVWQRINRQGRRSRAIFHFGDWHLAPEHLPARLAATGTSPMVIHQSPEPVWERLGANPQDHTFRTTSEQWVWLQTPPLSLWANLHQDLADVGEEILAEAGEHLCESAASLLATTFDLPQPSCRLSILPASCWAEFHATLPRYRAMAFDAKNPPRQTVFHPSKPLAWSPRKWDLSDLIQGAAHSLICDSPLIAEVSFRGSLRRNSFRFLCAHLVNPFLQVAAAEDLVAQLWPGRFHAKQSQKLIAEVTSMTLEDVGKEYVSATSEVLLERFWGQLTGASLAHSGQLQTSAVKDFLDLGPGVFDWSALTATIRVA